MKGCTLDLAQLQAWAVEHAGCAATGCPQCTPDRQHAVDSPGAEVHLTRLDQKILSAVLDIAACHLDDDDHGYIGSISTSREMIMLSRPLSVPKANLSLAVAGNSAECSKQVSISWERLGLPDCIRPLGISDRSFSIRGCNSDSFTI